MSNLTKYEAYTPEAAQEERDAIQAGSSSFLKIGEGRHVLRFLPPKVGQRSPFTKVWQHFINMPGRPDPIRFLCPAKEAKKFCPVCKKAQQLIDSSKESDRKKGFDIRAKRRIYANVIHRDQEEEGVQIFAFGVMIYKALTAIAADEDAGGDFTDPITGFDIVVERKGTGLNTEYDVRPSRRSSELGNMDWLAEAPSHAHLLKVPTLDEIKGMFAEGQSEPEPEEDESIDEFIDTDFEEA